MFLMANLKSAQGWISDLDRQVDYCTRYLPRLLVDTDRVHILLMKSAMPISTPDYCPGLRVSGGRETYTVDWVSVKTIMGFVYVWAVHSCEESPLPRL
jgi:hypothetical protein